MTEATRRTDPPQPRIPLAAPATGNGDGRQAAAGAHSAISHKGLVDPKAQTGAGARGAAGTRIDADAIAGDGALIGPHAKADDTAAVGAGAEVGAPSGDGTGIGPQAHAGERTRIAGGAAVDTEARMRPEVGGAGGFGAVREVESHSGARLVDGSQIDTGTLRGRSAPPTAPGTIGANPHLEDDIVGRECSSVGREYATGAGAPIETSAAGGDELRLAERNDNGAPPPVGPDATIEPGVALGDKGRTPADAIPAARQRIEQHDHAEGADELTMTDDRAAAHREADRSAHEGARDPMKHTARLAGRQNHAAPAGSVLEPRAARARTAAARCAPAPATATRRKRADRADAQQGRDQAATNGGRSRERYPTARRLKERPRRNNRNREV